MQSPEPQAPIRVLFVCLGNICRSPIALWAVPRPSSPTWFAKPIFKTVSSGTRPEPATGTSETPLTEVPDPYFTGGFDTVFDLVSEGCRGLSHHIREERGL